MKDQVLCGLASLQVALEVIDSVIEGKASGRSPQEIAATADQLRQSLRYNQADQIENDKALEFEAGAQAARRGEQVVACSLDESGYEKIPESWLESDRPLCRIVWFEDPGDASVGMQGVYGWHLASNQSGTQIEALVRGDMTAFRPIGEVMVSTLEQRNVLIRLTSGVTLFGRIIGGRFCEYHPDVDRFVDSDLSFRYVASIMEIPS